MQGLPLSQGRAFRGLGTGGLILDVGCMNFDYYPISVSTVADIMRSRAIKTEDHHQHE